MAKGIAGLVIRQSVELAVAAERARCAKVCREVAESLHRDPDFDGCGGALKCAAAIERAGAK